MFKCHERFESMTTPTPITTVFLPVLFHGVYGTSKSCHGLQKVSEMASWEFKGSNSIIIANGVLVNSKQKCYALD